MRDILSMWHYLQSMPTWDGFSRVDELFIWLGAEDNLYSREVARRWMIGAVARTYEPGCVHDWMPILAGPSGCGKSMLIDLLFCGEVFSAKIPIKNIELEVLYREEPLAVEFYDIRFTPTSLRNFESFVSQPTDQYWVGPKRGYSKQKRRWAFIGTTTPDLLRSRLLTSRNLFVVPVQGNAVLARNWVGANCVQLWAEAIALYQQSVGDRREGIGWGLDDQSAHLASSEMYDARKEFLGSHLRVLGCI